MFYNYFFSLLSKTELRRVERSFKTSSSFSSPAPLRGLGPQKIKIYRKMQGFMKEERFSVLTERVEIFKLSFRGGRSILSCRSSHFVYEIDNDFISKFYMRLYNYDVYYILKWYFRTVCSKMTSILRTSYFLVYPNLFHASAEVKSRLPLEKLNGKFKKGI